MKRIATIAAVITTAAVAVPVASGGNVVATANTQVVKQIANKQVVRQIANTQVAKSHRAYALIAMQRHQIQIAHAQRWALLRAQLR